MTEAEYWRMRCKLAERFLADVPPPGDDPSDKQAHKHYIGWRSVKDTDIPKFEDHNWTNADIDAAYLMGCINCDSVEVENPGPWPTLDKTLAELDRLKGLGFEAPHLAIRKVRYGKEQ